MQRRVKERLIGAVVLVMLAVILIPILLDDSTHTDREIQGPNIPERPDEEFFTRMVPMPDTSSSSGPVQEEADLQHPPAALPVEATENQAALASESGPTVNEAITVEAASSVAVTTEAGKTEVGLTAWVVQLGSFSKEENANKLNEELRTAGFSSFVEPLKQGNTVIYRVRVGPELMRSDAQRLKQDLENKLNLNAMILEYP